MIIDFHAHIFPDSLAKAALSRLVENLRRYEPNCDPNAPYTDATASGLADSQGAAGIDISVIMPIATSTKPSPTLNNFAARINRMSEFCSFGSVHPKSPDALHELERIRELGLRGIKLHPEYQGCYADDKDTVSVVRRAGELGLYVLFHSGSDIGMPPPTHGAPEHFVRLRQAAPDTKIILAHMGAFRMWEAAERLFPDMGFYIDTSFSLEVYPEQHERFAHLIRIIGTDHVLFGTDSPWADRTYSLRVARDFLKKHRFTQHECDAILGGNAAALLGIR